MRELNPQTNFLVLDFKSNVFTISPKRLLNIVTSTNFQSYYIIQLTLIIKTFIKNYSINKNKSARKMNRTFNYGFGDHCFTIKLLSPNSNTKVCKIIIFSKFFFNIFVIFYLLLCKSLKINIQSNRRI